MISLDEVLSESKNKNPIFIPLRGNAGDSFIGHCTYQAFERRGFKIDVGHEDGFYPDRWIILAGGGNLVLPYPNGRRFLERNLNKWRRLIILPHSIRAYEKEIWNKVKDNCAILCREAPSYDFVRSNSAAEVGLAHDMAFFWDRDQTVSQFRSQFFFDLSSPKLLLRQAKRTLRSACYLFREGFETHTLNAMRTDLEKGHETKLTPINIDVAQAFAADDMSPVSSLHAAGWMMEFISLFDSVRTDRLHVGIMATLMGQRVQLIDNSYGKNSSVFMQSMRGRFPNVAIVNV
jgi:exopolysaccharide biosynthesis predicted pyruvyltransferase EpsI